MVLQELAPGLGHWTARHPNAEENPTPGSPADWPPEVGCVAYDANRVLSRGHEALRRALA